MQTIFGCFVHPFLDSYFEELIAFIGLYGAIFYGRVVLERLAVFYILTKGQFNLFLGVSYKYKREPFVVVKVGADFLATP